MRNDGDKKFLLDEVGRLKPCPDTVGLGVVWYDVEQDDAGQDDDEHEPDYCARCRYASRCMGWCSVPPELF